MTGTSIIAEIERYAEEHGLAPATVTSKAVRNSRLYHRLKAGGGCTVRIAEQLRAYMATNAEPSNEKQGAA